MKILSSFIVNILLTHHIVDKNDIEIYIYGTQLFINKLLHCFVILLTGLICGILPESIIFLLTYSQIRRFAGGFHAKNNVLCIIYTYIMFISVVFINNYMDNELFNRYNLIISIGSSVFIYFSAPVDSSNKVLTRNEIYKYKRMTGFILLLINMVIIIFRFFNIQYYNIMILSILFGAISIALGIKDSPRYINLIHASNKKI